MLALFSVLKEARPRASAPDIVRIGDTAREREQAAFAERIGALVGPLDLRATRR